MSFVFFFLGLENSTQIFKLEIWVDVDHVTNEAPRKKVTFEVTFDVTINHSTTSHFFVLGLFLFRCDSKHYVDLCDDSKGRAAFLSRTEHSPGIK